MLTHAKQKTFVHIIMFSAINACNFSKFEVFQHSDAHIANTDTMPLYISKKIPNVMPYYASLTLFFVSYYAFFLVILSYKVKPLYNYLNS